MVRAATRQTTSTAGGTRQGVSRWYATASRTASAVTSRDHHAEAVEVRVDHAGGARERDVAVVARVRRVDGAGEAVVGAPGEQVALDLRAPGVGGDHHQRGVGAVVGPVRRPISAAGVSNGASSGKPGTSAGACEATRGVPSGSSTSPTAFTTTSAATTTSPSRADAVPIPPVVPCSPPRHFATVAPRPAPDPSGGERRRVGLERQRRARRDPRRRRAVRRPRPRGRRSPPRARSAPDHHAWGSPRPCSASALHDAVGGREPERRSAGEHDRVDVLDGGERIEHRGLPRRRRAAADLAPSRRSRAGTPRRSRRWRRRSSARRARRGRR